ncbi:MAG: malonyl-CoA synthase [Kiloniellales bacterium]|nr:malonyl-CoA synthase [Kiloniellales bacterium]
MSENLFQKLRAGFPDDRSRTAIELPDGRIHSYADLEAASGRFARLLRDLGVAPGDRVAVQVEKSAEALFLYLACLRAGAIYLPLNTAYTPAEIAYFLGDAEPVVFVCTPAAEAALRDVAGAAGVAHLLTQGQSGEGSLAEAARDLDPEAGCAEAAADDIAAILYTSGTTGRSKGAMLSHGNLASNAAALHRIWGFRAGDVLLHALPLFHVHGLFVASNTALLNGSRIILLPRFDVEEVLRRLPEATVFMGVPTFYTRLLATPDFDAETCGNIRLFVSGSAPLLTETFEAFRARSGHSILERYGMTEAGMITSNPLEGERRAGTVGLPLPEVEVRIRAENGGAVPAGEIGVLELRGPNVFKGYWRNPEKTAEEFRADGFFVTGDLARIDDRGYVQIVGRAKDLIISGGYNVYPKEVEQAIDELDGVQESAVIGLPHPDFGEAVAAVVVPASGGPSPEESEIIARLKGRLAGYKVPKRIFTAETLPRNAMGKVQKNELREEHRDAFP